MREEPRYWFPAKTYGWGWGLPTTWQGMLVMVAFVALVVFGAIRVLPRHGVFVFVAYTVLLGIALTFVCWWKGEPPRWRWGRERQD
jgi:hypothetical protein